MLQPIDVRVLATVTGGASNAQNTRSAHAQQFTSALGGMAGFWQTQPIISGRK